jgi:hypothetical protein
MFLFVLYALVVRTTQVRVLTAEHEKAGLLSQRKAFATVILPAK